MSTSLLFDTEILGDDSLKSNLSPWFRFVYVAKSHCDILAVRVLQLLQTLVGEEHKKVFLVEPFDCRVDERRTIVAKKGITWCCKINESSPCIIILLRPKKCSISKLGTISNGFFFKFS